MDVVAATSWHDYTETLNYILKMNTITFKHSGHAGDIIYSLASVQHLCEARNTQAIFYIAIGVKTDIKGHSSGETMIPGRMFTFLRPLIESQPYISEVKPYQGEAVDYDLDLFRSQNPPLNLSGGNIAHWYSQVYPELNPNLARPWLYVDPIRSGVLLARTERYLNPLTMPHALIKGSFIGTDREWAIINQHPNGLQRLKVDTALDMAQHITGSDLVISNQTLMFAIAEALKVRRILEQFWFAPNVIPCGGEYFIYNTQEQLKKILLYLQNHGRN